MGPTTPNAASRQQGAQPHDFATDTDRHGGGVTRLSAWIGRRSLPWQPRHNQLLAALPAADYERIRRALAPIDLPSGHVVCDVGRCPEHAYFPVAGIVSLTHELANGATAEVAVTGSDGMVGMALVLGGGGTTTRAVVRAATRGYALRPDALAGELRGCEALRQVLLRYAQALLTQMTQAAVCRGHHSVEQQLCRLLLVTLDRLPGDELALTHDAIGTALGVRRESVTAVAGKLQTAGLIRYHRGRMAVLERDALERRACECYGVVRAESDRLARLQHAEHAAPARIGHRFAHGVSGRAGRIPS